MPSQFTPQHEALGISETLASSLPPAAWTCRQSAYPRDRSVHEIFLEVAAHQPERPAIRTESGEIAYRELDRRANQLARFLISQGITIGDRVGLLLDRSPELIIAELAILKAGSVYVPIDPGTPPERVAFFARDAALRLLICVGDDNDVPSVPELRLLRLDREAAAIAQTSASNPRCARQGGDPAYVMYTSGSSGTPKGVEIPHRGILRLVLGQDYFPTGPEQCTLLLGSPGFDGTTYEIWSALLNGGCCAIFPDRWVDHPRLEHVIRSLGATCLSISTGLFNQIIDRRPRLFETARHVMIVGEAISVPHIRRAMEAMPHVQFGNGYGPTECTTFGCTWIIGDPATWGCESVPLGFPLNNTECHIVDANLRPTPIGVAGELLLGGDGLALCYLNRPDLTAERFIRHPFSSDPTARLYRTGDRCYWIPNGMIAYVGRDDDQVKLRGYRIELGEVEAALRLCPGIGNAAVVVHTFPSGVRGLIGCIVAESGRAWDESATLATLALRLPEAMLPDRIFRVGTLPLTQNGKVDRHQLAAVVSAGFAADRSAHSPSETSSPPLPPDTAPLLELWQAVLKDASLNADSDFFRCGGDSLLAVELAAEIERLLGRRIQVGILYRFSTPRQLAHWWQDSMSQDAPAAAADAVALVGDGPGAPVFFVPGMDGYGLIPKSMAQTLAGWQRPYFDRLTYPAVKAGCQGSLSVEDIAGSLIVQVRRVCPHGPYVLVGYSFGGLVAYELARRLTAAGETVEQVILWDAYPLAGLERRSLPAIVARLIRLAFSPARWSDRDWLAKKLAGLRRRIGALWEQAIGAITHNPVRQAKPFSSTVPTAEAFQPQPYAGRVSLLACTVEDDWIFDRYVIDRDGWARVVPPDRFTVFDFPCTHLEALKPPHLDSFIAKTLELIEATRQGQAVFTNSQ